VASELQIPPGIASDKNACELVRAWAAHGGLQCSLNVGAWKDDKAQIGWGILLSDIARHVADALYQSQNTDKNQTLSKIRAVFNSELNGATAETQGKFV
jgi:Domain of unknown function (DUF5076)